MSTEHYGLVWVRGRRARVRRFRRRSFFCTGKLLKKPFQSFKKKYSATTAPSRGMRDSERGPSRRPPVRAPSIALQHRGGFSERAFYLHVNKSAPLGAPAVRGGERDADNSATLAELQRNVRTLEGCLRPSTSLPLMARPMSSSGSAATSLPWIRRVQPTADAPRGAAGSHSHHAKLEAFEARYAAMENMRAASKPKAHPQLSSRLDRDGTKKPVLSRPIAPMIVRTPIPYIPNRPSSPQRASPPAMTMPEDGHLVADEPDAETPSESPGVDEGVVEEDYRSLGALCSLFDDSDVQLVRASFLLELAGSGELLPRRQDLPAHAIVDGLTLSAQLKEVSAWDEYLTNGPTETWHAQLMRFPPVVCISHAWATRSHPDPDGRLLRQVIAPALEWYMGERANLIKGGGASHVPIDADLTCEGADFGVFIDWSSVHQDDGSLTDGQQASRSHALSQMGLLFAHPATCVWRLTRSLYPEFGPVAIAARGWPFFEAVLSAVAKPPWHVLNLGVSEAVHMLAAYKGVPRTIDELVARINRIPGDKRLSFYMQSGIAFQERRRPPMTPSEFAEQLMRKALTVEADRELLESMQRRVVLTLLRTATELDFSSHDWRTDEVKALVRMLPACRQLHTLNLSFNFLGPESSHAVARIIGAGHPTLKVLDLGYTSLGAAGVVAICVALKRNTTLEEVKLRGCAFDANARSRLEEIASKRRRLGQPPLLITYDAHGLPDDGRQARATARRAPMPHIDDEHSHHSLGGDVDKPNKFTASKGDRGSKVHFDSNLQR